MDASLFIQTVISGALVSAALFGFLYRFAPRRTHWPHVFAAVIFLDQGSKWLVAALVKGGAPHFYLGGAIGIGYYTNYLQGFGASSPWLLCATLVGVIGGIRLSQMLIERRYIMSSATETGLALLLAGVAVIAVERTFNGFVVDFIQFGRNAGYVWNFADLSAIAGSVILFLRGMAVLPAMLQAELSPVETGGGE
jgi:lipoprotein signal peptidase